MSEIERIELTLGKNCPFGMRTFGAPKCSRACALFIERQINTFVTNDDGELTLDDEGMPIVVPKLFCGCVFVHTERAGNDTAGSVEVLSQIGVKAFEALNVTAQPGRVKEREELPVHLIEAE